MVGFFIMPFGRFISYKTAVRVNGQQVRTWAQFESSLPTWKLEPVSVEVEKNDTKVEGYQVFTKLVELSGIGMTPEEVLSDLWYEKLTNDDWEQKFWDADNGRLDDWFGLCVKFLNRNYHRRWAYIKVGDREIYGQVSVSDRKFHMKTSAGILTMPCMYVSDTVSGENKYVFFPMAALLKDSEQALFELCRTTTAPSDTTQLEMQIMRLVEQLSLAKSRRASVLETNSQFADIEEMCRTSGVIEKLYVQDWKLALQFCWRTVKDTDWERSPMVLPPLKLLIDLRNYTVRWDHCYHPHVLNDYSLCMGGTLTDLVQKCITNRDLKTLVGGMIDFGNSWTSSDAWESEREPWDCIYRYCRDNTVDRANVPISKEDIYDTISERWWEKSDLPGFAALFD